MAADGIKTEKDALEAIKAYPSIINIPEEFRTEKVCLAALKRQKKWGEEVLRFVPEKSKTKAVCTAAVKNSGRELAYVPEKIKTSRFCAAAVKAHGEALEYVPEEFKTAKTCLKVVSNECMGDMIRHVPESLKTAGLCLAAVKTGGEALAYVPEELKTAELCLEALNKEGRGHMLAYVPESLKTAGLCLAAVKADSRALEYVPEELKTAELCDEAVGKYGYAIRYVPQKVISAELCLKAVKGNAQAFRFVPDGFKTAQMCLELIGKHGFKPKYMPESNMTPELCMEAVRKDGRALQYVPENLKTAEMCLEAVKRRPEMFCHVPIKFITVQMALASLKEGGMVFGELLARSIDRPEIMDVIDRLATRFPARPFTLVRQISISELFDLAVREPPQTMATLMAFLKPRQSAYMLKKLSHEMRIDVIRRIIEADFTDTESFRDLERELENKLSARYGGENANVGHVERIAKVLALTDNFLGRGASEKQSINIIREESPELARELDTCTSIFHNIVMLDDESVKAVLREANASDLAKALKAADTDVHKKVFGNMSKHDMTTMQEDMEYMGPIKWRDVLKARREIVSIIRRIEKSGGIVVERSNADAWARGEELGGLSKIDGKEAAIKILGHAGLAMGKSVVESLETEAPEFKDLEIMAHLFIFWDIVLFSSRDIQFILREVESEVLALALVDVDPSIQEMVFGSMSKRAADMLREHMETLGPVSDKDVMEARDKLISVIYRLEADGEIYIARAGGDEGIV